MPDDAPPPSGPDGERASLRRTAHLAPLALALALAAPGGAALAQVSPGPLSHAHRSLEGNLRCFDCHGTGSGKIDGQCLACHAEIAWLIGHERGLHAREGRSKCASCHPEHAGESFSLTGWPEGGPRDFDHARAGWPLAGKHAPLDCRRCHTPKLRVSEAVRLAPRREVAGGWTGLDTRCSSCHEDAHRGALGADCERCHTAESWNRVSGFDHARTAYPLLGKHAAVPCEKCHMAPGLTLPVDAQGKARPLFKPLPHEECSACHADTHRGRLGPACARCHVVAGFRVVDQAAFDHDRTRYPLRGRHRAATCAACHGPPGGPPRQLAFGECGDCHRDPHAGRGTLGGKAVDCAACHGIEGFRPSTYTVAQHDFTAYPLEGRHAQAACDTCHVKRPAGVPAETLGSAAVQLRPPHGRCADCHKDAHGSQLASRREGPACEGCHTPAGWKPSLFDEQEHGALRLPLAGGHAEIACGACHGPVRRELPALAGPEILGSAKIALTGLPAECEGCHRDPHAGRLSRRADGRTRACTNCHDPRARGWSSLDAAAHEGFGFPLEGAHRVVPCAECHRELRGPRGASSLLLASASGPALELRDARRGCVECHADPHGGQFASRPEGGACEACHDVGAFRPASKFDHARDAAFVLDGAHVRVACARCHVARTDAAGPSVVVYRPLGKRCEDCHTGTTGGQR